jgi:hypothetical protein
LDGRDEAIDAIFFRRGLKEMRSRGILEETSAALLAAEPTYVGATPAGGVEECRWGVVQLVGHLTVNEDGEGSNPSAPANFFFQKYGINGGCCYTDCTTFVSGPISRFPTPNAKEL